MRSKHPYDLWLGFVLWIIGFCAATAIQADELIDLGDIPVEKVEPKPMQTVDFLFGYIGGAIVHSERIVGNKGSITIPFPLLGINYKDAVYWNVTKGGAWLWKSRDHQIKFGPMVKLRLAVNTDNDEQLDGLTKRKGSLEAGLGIAWFSYLKTSLEVYQDFSGRSDGASAQLKTSKLIKLNDHITIIPSLTFEWLSEDVVDYYYGVDAKEAAITGIATYQGRSTNNIRGGITVADHSTKNWAVLGGVMYQRYGNAITDSPIVNQSSNTVFYLGATYIFLKF